MSLVKLFTVAIQSFFMAKYSVSVYLIKNGAIKTKAFVKGLFVPKLNIVGGAVSLIQQLPI